MPWLERLLFLVLGVLLVAALVLLMRHDIARHAAKPPASAAGAGRFWF